MGESVSPDPTQPKVVATFSILGDLAANVGGEDIELLVLAGPNSDPHAYEPTPAEVRRLADADLLLEIGQDYEGWIDGIYDSSGSNATRLILTEGMELREFEGAHHHHDHDHGHSHGHDHHHHDHEYDPHVWTDVALTKQMVENIRDGLVELDPANAENYQTRAQAYLGQLQELDSWILQEVARIPGPRRILIGHHDGLGYFAARYGFSTPGSVLGAATTEAADPSARQMAALAVLIRESGSVPLFPEAGHSDRILRQVADEAGVSVTPPLYPEFLSDEDGPAPTYVDLMRYNVGTIVEALNE